MAAALCDVMRKPVTLDEIITRNLQLAVNEWARPRERALWADLAREVERYLPDEIRTGNVSAVSQQIRIYLGQRFKSDRRTKVPWNLDYLQAVLLALELDLAVVAREDFDPKLAEHDSLAPVREELRRLPASSIPALRDALRELGSTNNPEVRLHAFVTLLRAPSLGAFVDAIAPLLYRTSVSGEDREPTGKSKKRNVN